MALLFYGCKQLAHTEKDKHDFEPITVDTTVFDTIQVEERITDTITMVLDSIPVADTIPVFDTIVGTDSLTMLQDSVVIDTVKTVQKQRIRKSKPSDSAIETQVICSATDSSWRDMNQKKIYYFGNAEAKYDDITLSAACLEFDLETSTCRAYGRADSIGKLQGRPVFKQGESTFEATEMLYNFKSKKGIITKVWT